MDLTRKKRVLVADDHTLLAEGVAGFLSREFDVVGLVRDGLQLLEEAERLRPDFIVLDISMPRMNGIEAARKLRETLPEIKLIFVTQKLDPQYLRAAFQTGGRGYVAKECASEELLVAIHRVLEGSIYVTPLMEEKPGYTPPSELRRGRSPRVDQLTERQREVLQMVAEGKTSKQIADSLCISPKTVEFHKKALMDQTGLRTTAELTRYAITVGAISL